MVHLRADLSLTERTKNEKNNNNYDNTEKQKKRPACTKTQFLFIHKNYFGQFFSHFQST